MSINQRLKEAREAKGLSMQAAATRIGVKYQTIQKWEKEGGSAPNRTRMPRVVEVYETTEEFIRQGKSQKQLPLGGKVLPNNSRVAALTRWLNELSAERMTAVEVVLNAMGFTRSPTDEYVDEKLNKKVKR